MSFFVANLQPPKFIEDLILDLSYRSVILAPNDFKIIDSFSDQLFRGVSFTVKQGDLAVKMCKKYKAQLHATFGPLVDTIIAGPHFQLPLRESVKQLSQIKLVKEEKKYISVTFPYNENLVGEIRKFKENNKSDWADWHGEKKEWQFSLTEGSVYWLCQALIPKQFEVDSQILEFYEKICEIHENIEKYAPMLVVENDQPMFKNVYHEVPQPDTPDLLKGILMAKRHGIEVWDNNYENFINSEKITSLTKKFIEKEFASEMSIKAEDHPIEDWDQLLTNINAAMIVVPPDNELPHLRKWHLHLKSLGFTENQMTVMFRTDNITNKSFNDYIRENKLNSALSENIKFVFVSRRIKKPLIKSGINFDIVITCDSLGNNQAIRKILNDKYNAVVYLDKLKDKDFV